SKGKGQKAIGNRQRAKFKKSKFCRRSKDSFGGFLRVGMSLSSRANRTLNGASQPKFNQGSGAGSRMVIELSDSSAFGGSGTVVWSHSSTSLGTGLAMMKKWSFWEAKTPGSELLTPD